MNEQKHVNFGPQIFLETGSAIRFEICILLYICREGKNSVFYSKQSRVMTWQAHATGHAPSPPPTGRDEGEDTQVELVLLKHSFEQVELTAIPLFDCTCYFQHFGFY